jgi:hypothetical protein
MNQRVVQPILTNLVKTAFFRFFKVNIHCDCPLWPDDSMCMLQACSVCECDPNEVPQPWVAAEERSCAAAAAALSKDEEDCDGRSVQCACKGRSCVSYEFYDETLLIAFILLLALCSTPVPRLCRVGLKSGPRARPRHKGIALESKRMAGVSVI